jgi:peptidyl-prolyl cis-trans isomerase D
VLAKVKAGGNFAALAKQYSEDDVSKVNGGDLDFFGRGAMAKEFEDAAWALDTGQTSDLVKSQFGLHIIRLTGRKPATTRSLAEVRTQLEDAIRFEKARAEATRLAGEIGAQLKTPADLDRVATERGLTVRDSGLFAREEPLAGLGFAPAVSTEVFGMETGNVSGSLTTNQGYAFVALTEVKPSYLPTLDEARDKVREDVVRTKALEAAQRNAANLRKAVGNFTAAAKAAGATVTSTDPIARGGSIPGVGVSEKIDAIAFSLKPGEISEPIATDNAVVVVRAVERQEIVPAGLEADRETVRAELLQQRTGAFFNAYMTKARATMKIEYNEAAITSLVGS